MVPQGGNTSLAGGSVPMFDEVIISLKLMDKIISFNNLSGKETWKERESIDYRKKM